MPFFCVVVFASIIISFVPVCAHVMSLLALLFFTVIVLAVSVRAVADFAGIGMDML